MASAQDHTLPINCEWIHEWIRKIEKMSEWMKELQTNEWLIICQLFHYKTLTAVMVTVI